MRLQPIYDIAEVCAQQGVDNIVLCPGSRCAPLTIAFARHTKIKTRTFSDERSACFVALGMAQQINSPVGIVCTSGSASYNFAPAIAEAFFQEIPLIVFTADRPAEWIDQWDGQTIRQNNIYGSHVKRSYTLPNVDEHPDTSWHIVRVINEAIALSKEFPQGPVHINIPLREPLYPSQGEKITFSNIKKVKVTLPTSNIDPKTALSCSRSISQYSKVLVVGGQQQVSNKLAKELRQFCKNYPATLLGDVISNLHSIPETVRFADSYLGQGDESIKEKLRPQLLITFGKSVISKSLKQFLRTYKPLEHWHIQPGGIAPDTFQSLSHLIHYSPESFFESLNEIKTTKVNKDRSYQQQWKKFETKALRLTQNFFKEAQFSEFHVLHKILQQLPSECNLHLANSMSVRYANYIGLTKKNKGVRVYSNRGTSGIDGCTSTAVGHVINSSIPNILVTGDMAFFYDRNAFWNNYPLPNFHIVILNNHGGVIFNLIDGPRNLKERDEYFVTNQNLTAAHLAQEFGHVYLKIDSPKKIESSLQEFFSFDGKTKVLEILSNQQSAKQTFEIFKDNIKAGYET